MVTVQDNSLEKRLKKLEKEFAYFKSLTLNGFTGTFTAQDGSIVTVKKGIIISVVAP